MRRVVKWFGIVLGGLVGLTALAAAVLYADGSARLNKTYNIQVQAVTIPTDEAAIARGQHLAEGITLCTSCHGENLGGQVLEDAPMIFTLAASNLTAGLGGVGTVYSDADYVRAIRHGINQEGRGLIIMHSDIYHNLSKEDLGAIIAFVKSMPPVDNEDAKTRVAPLGRIFVALDMFDMETMPLIPAEVIDHDASFVQGPAQGPTAEYGEYLMAISLCAMCHGSDLGGAPPVEPGMPPGPNISILAAPGGWSQKQFATAVRTGVTPSRTLNPEFMPWDKFVNMTDEELAALWFYLQSLPPKE
ncbi:MAG TPA: c-type cytochrome [Anaerolineales bacterium]